MNPWWASQRADLFKRLDVATTKTFYFGTNFGDGTQYCGGLQVMPAPEGPYKAVSKLKWKL
jgi:hypothetical protein